jgi:DNA sulfur modification protein DndC
MGMRAQESSQRARQEPWSRDEALSKAGRTVFNWLPIFMETTEYVSHWHWKERVPLHPVYVPEYHRDSTSGGYLRRFSCRVCIFASDHHLRRIYEHDREPFDLVSDLEEQSGFTMKAGRSLVQIVKPTAYGCARLRSTGPLCVRRLGMWRSCVVILSPGSLARYGITAFD